MIPVVGMFRGLFLGGVLVWYSNSVWKTMDNYYNQEFKKYLQKEKDERRFPSEEDMCRAVPDARCSSAGESAAADATAAHADAEGAVEEALGASTAPSVSAHDRGAADRHAEGVAGGCTAARDVTHTGERSRHRTAVDSCAREEDEQADREFQVQPGDYVDKCPVRF